MEFTYSLFLLQRTTNFY